MNYHVTQCDAMYYNLAIGKNIMATKKTATKALSTRLLPTQRALIAEAAKLQGWPASRLIREAAVQYAANIMNMRNEDKDGLLGMFARRVGRQLCDTRLDYLDEHGKPVRHHPEPGYTPQAWYEQKARAEFILFDEGEFDGDPEADDDGARSVQPECFSDDDLDRLTNAIRLGGAEFMELVITWCNRFSSNVAQLHMAANQEYIDPLSMETVTLADLEDPERDPTGSGDTPATRRTEQHWDAETDIEMLEEDEAGMTRDSHGMPQMPQKRHPWTGEIESEEIE